MMLSLPPFRDVGNLRKDQKRRDRIKRLGLVEDVVARGLAVDVEIGQVLFRAPLRHQSLGHVGATTKNTRDSDFGILLMKLRVEHFKIGAAIEHDLPFFFCRLHCFVPVRLPVIGRTGRCDPRPGSEAKHQPLSRALYFFHFGRDHFSLTPLLHHSITPILRCSSTPTLHYSSLRTSFHFSYVFFRTSSGK